MTFTRTAAIVALLFAALPWSHALGQPRPSVTGCDNFDYLPAGRTYRPGASFTSPNSTATITQFLFLNGNPSANGYVKVDTRRKSGGTRLDLWINNATVDFTYARTQRRVTFRFGEYGGNLNFAVNGDFRNVANFADLRGQTVGGASLTVVNGNGNDKGTVTIAGAVSTLRIGGQELWIDDLCLDIRKGSTDRAALSSDYAGARAAESNVTRSLMQLDAEARSADDSARAQISAREKEMFALDTDVNTALKESYRAAFDDGRPDADRALVRTALLHWTTILRRRSMGSWHTVVAGLVDDPRCRGDVIADELLSRYFDTLFDDPDSETQRRHAVLVLADLARQSACLGERQSAQLASNLYWSFEELRTYLRDNGLGRLVPAVVQAAAAPLLLFYDVEKDRGPTAPLSRWFAENRTDLIDGAVTLRSPIAWQGLWLYERRSGTLLGFRVARNASARNAVNQNQVNLPKFLDSITRFTHLGDYACSFAEMVGRGESRLGYLCSSSSCAKVDPQSTNAAGQLSNFEPAFGVSDITLQETVCTQSGGGSGSSGGDSGNGPCSTGHINGDGAMSNLFNCVADLRMTSQQKFMRCFAEATGMCANPVDKFTKQLQQTMYGGVPMGTACQISKGKPPAKPEQKRTPHPEWKNCTNCIFFEDGALRNSPERAWKVQSVEDAQVRANAAILKVQQLKEQGADPDEIKKAEDTAKAAKDDYDTQKKDLDKFDETHKTNKGTGKNNDCPPDTPECGGNQCTAMSAQTQPLLACAEAQAGDPRTPEIPNAGVFDPPAEGNESSPQLAHCLESLTPPESRDHQCWAVTCARSRTTVLTAGGDCGCGSTVPSGGLIETRGTGDPLCGATLDCPADSHQEGCRCAPSGGTPGGGHVPGGVDRFKIASPPTYSKVAASAPR